MTCSGDAVPVDHPDETFTLVVDEIHTYRGTQGSEVALIVRKLLERLGLNGNSRQLRCIATSASLDPRAGASFLSAFFSAPEETFNVIPGQPVRIGNEDGDIAPAGPIDPTIFIGLPTDAPAREEALSRLATEHRFAEAVATACLTSNGMDATPISEIRSRLFTVTASDQALDAVLEAIALQPTSQSRVRFRTHLFIRMIRGMWACSNPACSAVAPRWDHSDRRIGKLYSRPTPICDCGSRVLGMLYCDICGEASLGGCRAGRALTGGTGLVGRSQGAS